VDVIKIVPCVDNRFIVFSFRNDLTGNNGSDKSPFCRISLMPDRQEFKIDHTIPCQKGSGMHNFAAATNNMILVCTDEHALLISKETGLFWIFSLGTASLKGTGQIFSKMTKEMVENGGFSGAIFEAHPEKDGSILISAQDDALFTTDTSPNTDKELAEMQKSNLSMAPAEAMKIIQIRSNERLARSPFFVWYRIFPESGKVEKLSDAPDGGTLLRQGLYMWRPMLDGSIKMGDYRTSFPSIYNNGLTIIPDDKPKNQAMHPAAATTATPPKTADTGAKKDDKTAK